MDPPFLYRSLKAAKTDRILIPVRHLSQRAENRERALYTFRKQPPFKLEKRGRAEKQQESAKL